MGVGFLMDETRIKIALAPVRLSDGPLLPIVYFSLAVKWRDGTSLKRDACIAICLLQQVQIPRVSITEEAMSRCVGLEYWLAIIQEASRIASEPPPIDDTGVPHDFEKELQSLKSALKEQKQEIKKLKKELAIVKEECDHTPRAPEAKKSRLKCDLPHCKTVYFTFTLCLE